MAFLPRRDPEAKAVGASAFLPSMLSMWSLPEAQYPDPVFHNNVLTGFEKNELVYACIMEKATSMPEAPLKVFGADLMGEPRDTHPLRLLLEEPNPILTEFEQMELTLIHLDLAGVAFWEIVTSRGGDVPPNCGRCAPTGCASTRSGRAGRCTGSCWTTATSSRWAATWCRSSCRTPPTPTSASRRCVRALRSVALDNEATDFVKALLQNKAVPGSVIETEQELDQATADRLSAKWKERFSGRRRGEPAFLQKGMKVQALGLDLRELEFPDLRTISETRICAAFGVPPILIGAKAGLDRSTFANYAEARTSFWEETLMPLQRRIALTVAKKLLPMMSGPKPRKVAVRFDNSNVRALRESEGKRWELGTNALRAGGITVNDYRRYIGLAPVTGGDVFLMPAGVVPVAALDEPLPAAPGGGTSVPAEPVEEPSQEAASLPMPPMPQSLPPGTDNRWTLPAFQGIPDPKAEAAGRR